MSRRTKNLKYSRAENRHPAARLPQATESLSAFLWDHLLQRERENKLPWLTPQFATACYEEYRRGDYAQIQLLWDQLEEYDETLATVVAARLGAIAEMPWSIVVDADAVGADAGLQALANAQQASLSAELARVENLEEAIAHLAMADFRGVAALELVQNADTTRWRWESIEPWCLARPARRGPWMYNAEARSNPSRLEGLEPTRTIIREARPIDLPAMYLIVAKRHAIEGWDSVLDTFGVPSIFMELPPGTSQEMADYYTALVRRIVGDGRGTIPSGAKFQTVETRQNTTTPFAERARWCNEGIITLATGGLLTVSTEAGSGTLAGNAHADSLARLCALSARSISSCINRQWARRVLESQYPGQPALARFELAPEQEEDTTATVQQLSTLAGAGWKPSDETVSEMLGYEVTSAPAPESKPAALQSLLPVSNRQAVAADEGETADEPEGGVPEDIERLLAEALRPEVLAADAAALARGMEEALTNSCNQYAHEPGCPDADNRGEPEEPEGGWLDEPEDPYADEEPAEPAPAPVIPEAEEPRPAAPESRPRRVGEALLRWMSHIFLPARIARRRYEQEHGPIANREEEAHSVENSCNQHAHEPGCTGANLKKQKGARHSKGNPAGKPNKSNVPTMLPETATDGELERQLRKALDATDMHSGNQTVTRGRETYSLTQQRSDHRRKHQGEGATNEAIAKTLTQGSFEKDGTDGTAYRKKTKVIKYTNPGTGAREIRTAYYEPDYRPRDRRKNPGQEPGPTDR